MNTKKLKSLLCFCYLTDTMNTEQMLRVSMRQTMRYVGSCMCVTLVVYCTNLLRYQSATEQRDESVLLDDPINGTVLRFIQRKGSILLHAEESFTMSFQQKTAIGFPVDVAGVKPLTTDTFYNFVFVTAASENHFHEAMDAIAVVQMHFPKHTLVYYDLDTDLSMDKVNKIKQLCNVVYRKFNYDAYPKHVQNLMTYAFKPLVIYDVLHDYKTVFWMDSSVRFHTSNLDVIRDQLITGSSDIMLFDDSGHSIFAATHVGMFRYLPITKSSAVNVTMRGAPTYIHCTQQLHDGVIRWWALCALEPMCIAPTTDFFCSFHGRDQYANCHRYDQSAMSLLTANHLGDDESKFAPKREVTAIVGVYRDSSNLEFMRICRPNGTVDFLKSQSYY